MEKITFTRRQLYDLVWATPMTILSKKYQIPFHQLRSTYAKMDIPLPEYGHWMKLRYKKPAYIKALPTEYKGEEEVTFDINDSLVINKNKIISDRNKLLKEIKENPKLRINVSSKLKNPDKLVIAAKQDLTPEKHPFGNYNGLMSTSGGLLNITVAPKNVGRALRFMDAFIKLLKARGHDAKITDRGACAIIFGEDIIINLQEKLRIEESIDKWGWRNRKYFPSDILTFRAWKHFRFHQKVWGTGKYSIESQLPEIIATLELLAKKEKEERKRHEEEHKIWLEQQRIEKEIQERTENEFRRFKELFIQASLLHKANVLRDYVRTVELNATKNGNLSDDLKNWITWATNKIDWFDPLINQDDPILDDDCRKSLYRDLISEF